MVAVVVVVDVTRERDDVLSEGGPQPSPRRRASAVNDVAA
jgi:hypothetical protein